MPVEFRHPEVVHFSELDGMRGILACTVMLMHYGMNSVISTASRGAITRGEWGLSVDFFFILSGFVLARSFLARPVSPGDYLIKRILRLAPMYLLTLCATIAVLAPGEATTVLANALIVQSFFSLPSINFPSWSIPFEMFLPMIGLTCLTRCRRSAERLAAPVLALFVVGGSACAYRLVQGLDMPLGRAVFGLGSGIALFLVAGPRLNRLRCHPAASVGLFAAIGLVMLVAATFPMVALAFHPLACAAVVVGAATRSPLSTAPCQALGRWSYAIYLCHIPILLAAERAFGTDALRHSPSSKVSLMVLTVAVSAGAYHLVERPLMGLWPTVRDRRVRAAARGTDHVRDDGAGGQGSARPGPHRVKAEV